MTLHVEYSVQALMIWFAIVDWHHCEPPSIRRPSVIISGPSDMLEGGPDWAGGSLVLSFAPVNRNVF